MHFSLFTSILLTLSITAVRSIYLIYFTLYLTVPGNWTDWTTWSDCSTTCGGGVSIRTRDCDTSWIPGLKAPCEGEEEGAGTESQPCHEFSCDTG